MKKEYLLFLVRALLFIALITPLIQGGVFSFNFAKTIFLRSVVEGAFFLYIFLILKDRSFMPRNTILLKAVLLFLGSFFLSSLLGENIFKSFWGDSIRAGGFINLFHLFLFFFMASSVFRKKDFKALFGVSIIVASLSIIWSFLAWKSGFIGTVGNPALFAGYLLFNLYFAVYLLSTGKKYYARMFYIIFIFASVVAIYLTKVRGAFLALVPAVILSAGMATSFLPREKSRRLLMVLVAAVYLAIGVLAVNYFYKGDLLNQLTSTTTVETRLDSWSVAFKGAGERWLLGWGPENFDVVYAKYFNPLAFIDSQSENYWDRPHNIFLEVLISQGLVGLVIYIFMIVSVFLAAKKESEDKESRFFIFSALTAYLIHTFFIFDSVSSYLMFFLLLAYISAPREIKEWQVSARAGTNQLVLIFSIFIIAASFYYLNFKSVQADSYFRQAKRLYVSNLSGSLENFKLASGVNIADKFLVRRELASLVSSKADYYDKSGILLGKEEFSVAIDLMKINLEEEPSNVFNYLYLGMLEIQYGRLYQEIDSFQSAEVLLTRAKNLFPNRQQVYYLLGEAELELGYLESDQVKISKAIETLKYALSLNVKSPESYWRLALIQKKAGRIDDALANAKRAEELLYGGFSSYIPDIFRLIDLHIEARDYPPLLTWYGKVTKNRPNYVQAYASLATIYRDIGDLEIAKAFAEKAVEADPRFKKDVEIFIKNLNL